MAFLTYETKGRPQRAEIADTKVSIGRGRSAMVRLRHDPKISSVHCELIRRPEGYVLKDRNSRNGTRVNGKLLGDQEVPIEHGDTVRIGDTKIRFHEYATEEKDGLLARLRSWFGRGS